MTAMVDPLALVVYALAFMRVVGLITADAITEPIRDRIVVKLDDSEGSLGSWVSYLITCPWCASVWVAMIAAPLIWNLGHSPWLLVPALGLALSQLAGMASNLGR